MLVLPPSDHFLNFTWSLPCRKFHIDFCIGTPSELWDVLLFADATWHSAAGKVIRFCSCFCHIWRIKAELSFHVNLCPPFPHNSQVLGVQWTWLRASCVPCTVMGGDASCPHKGYGPHYPFDGVKLLNLLFTYMSTFSLSTFSLSHTRRICLVKTVRTLSCLCFILTA